MVEIRNREVQRMARTIEEERARAKIAQIESSVRRSSHRRWPGWISVAFLGAGPVVANW